MTAKTVAVAVAVAMIVVTSAAQAHYPVCTCKMVDDRTVQCTGGFANGAKAPGLGLDVIGRDEQILVQGRLGADSTFRFTLPSQDFYILFDAGPGHTVEVEPASIK